MNNLERQLRELKEQVLKDHKEEIEKLVREKDYRWFYRPVEYNPL